MGRDVKRDGPPNKPYRCTPAEPADYNDYNYIDVLRSYDDPNYVASSPRDRGGHPDDDQNRPPG